MEYKEMTHQEWEQSGAPERIRKDRFEVRSKSFVTGDFGKDDFVMFPLNTGGIGYDPPDEENTWNYDRAQSIDLSLIRGLAARIERAGPSHIPRDERDFCGLERKVIDDFFGGDTTEWNDYLSQLKDRFGKVCIEGITTYITETSGIPFYEDRMLFLSEVGPTDEELSIKYDTKKRDEFWKKRFGCTDGFIAPHDTISIPDPEWRLFSGHHKWDEVLEEPKVVDGMYDTQGAFERCYHYKSSLILRDPGYHQINPHRIIELTDVKKIYYHVTTAAIEEDLASEGREKRTLTYLLEWDDDTKAWTNSVYDDIPKYGAIPQPTRRCRSDMTEEAYKALARHFSPIAERFGVSLDYDIRKMITEATKKGPGLIGSYFEDAGKPMNGRQIQNGIKERVKVEVYQTLDNRTILLKEANEEKPMPIGDSV